MAPITSLLVANRGEIARRIIRTARRMGVRTVAVFSDADANSPHVHEADLAVEIGPAGPSESYLSFAKLLAGAARTGADAIHPGYGFLSENADFAQAVIDAGLVWVGPPPAAIRAMGRKDAAKRLMAAAGVPVTPGYLGEDQSSERLATEAAAIGWPVLIKAVAGGGGKGMRKVARAEDFADALAAARREAVSAFGDERVLLETFVAQPRHIEVQVFGDAHGDIVHLFERDCSLQRRHQKVIEEAPAPGLDAATREALCATAVRAAAAVAYQGAGTVEFIADASRGLAADRIWFMEMNTRLQVEHPVTEMVTGLDLVEWQLRVAAGKPLPLTQSQIQLTGHAIEARLYAEDPANGFLPSTGPLKRFRLPQTVRIDSGFEEGGEISPHYDPLIAKLIAHAATREAAAKVLSIACRSVKVWPVKTNASFLASCLEHRDFVSGAVDTSFIDARIEALTSKPEPRLAPGDVANACTALDDSSRGPSKRPWSSIGGAIGFRMNAPTVETCRIYVDGAPVEASFDFRSAAPALIAGEGEAVVFAEGSAFVVRRARERERDSSSVHAGASLRAPMPGKIVSISVVEGQTVRRGQTLAALEAMKMEHALTAPFDGTIAEIPVQEGDQVTEGALLVRLDAPG
jgi:acetyl/propionyl-CoA carboxylase alpha subunit